MAQASHMAPAASTNNPQPSFRSASPSSEASPTPALGSCPELSRCVSTASSLSHGSSTDAAITDSLSGDYFSRQSSGSYHARRSDIRTPSRHSTHGHDAKGRRRGYMRPQASDFAASAKSRESVMSLGSIAHLQYYFARTGLLDGKGGQIARKKQQQTSTLDLSALDTTSSDVKLLGTDADSSYASMGSSPDLGAQGFGSGRMAESPTGDGEEDYYEDSFAESDPGMLPPTVSTYHHKQKTVPRPPTIVELKAELESCLQAAAKALQEVGDRRTGTHEEFADAPELRNMPEENTQGWYELQGMHILDVVTLAIRGAKMYYTAHELPDRLDAIKSEKQVRADLLAVMETLKQMATRGFRGGMRPDELTTMTGWIDSVFDILKQEREIENAVETERASWVWLEGDWSGRERERERAFLTSMDCEAEPLPEWTSTSSSDASELPSPFLKAMQNGVRLIRLHNAVVKRSRRRYGAIPTFHADTQKPYRCADNLRYWTKAAELRFEVLLRVDAIGVAYGSDAQAWLGFEAAILQWSRHLREEITAELGR